MWTVLRGPANWIGGGMSPERMDRAQILARLDPDVPRWIVDELLDQYEPAVIASRHTAAKVRKAVKPLPTTPMQ